MKIIEKQIRFILFPLFYLRRKFILALRTCQGKRNPERLSKKLYKKKLGKELNLQDPKDLNEKINWLKFYSDTTQWSELADKYAVREYVKKCGLENLLVELYGVWENAEEIDFDLLPKSFVLKATHASGCVIVVEDKDNLNISKTKKELNRWLKMPFGSYTAEPHYLKIKPRIIAEEYLSTNSKKSSSLEDYKIWCFNGEPYNIWICSERKKGSLTLDLYDLDWNPKKDCMIDSPRYKVTKNILTQPDSIKVMLAASRVLSKGFPQVRVDFYDINGKVYFGEMTFTATMGMINYHTPEYLLEMGKMIKT